MGVIVYSSTAGVAVRDNTIFLAKRLPIGEMGNLWEFPGGKAENDETPESALKREFHEEFEIEISVKNLFYKGNFRHNSKEYCLYAYFVDFSSSDLFLHEHSETGWFTLDEIMELPMAESDQGIAQFLIEHSNILVK